jgi:D-amino-acid oxidase
MIRGWILLVALSCSLLSAEHLDLKAPRLSEESILGHKVGIRPCRKTGVRLEVDPRYDRLLIHNYGYGSSGITLSLGGAQEATRLVTLHATPSDARIAVLGAGVIGLTTAYDLAQQGYDVRVYADAYSPRCTSDVPMGIWTPPNLDDRSLPREKKQLLQKLLDASRARFEQCLTDHPTFQGVRWVDVYRFYRSPTGGECVTIHFDNDTTRTAQKTRDILIEPSLFMQDLYSKLQAKGVPFHERHFADINDVLALEEPILVNCMSMGSRSLFNDDELFGVRGHLVHFKPEPGCDYFLSQRLLVRPDGCDNTHFWVNVYASPECIKIGGVTEERGIEDLEPDPAIIDQLIENAREFIEGNL